VSWKKVQAWLTKAGDGLRLPWEREWEYACRAGTETRFFWGQEMDFSYCWERGNSGGQTHKVTEHVNQSNALGLVDTLGNVAEWCQDEYQDRELWHIEPYRIARGGHVDQDAVSCRCAAVNLGIPFLDERYVGFRVALTLPGMS
jgi:formylglycine-generating enzyme required for sulfatase activity